MTRYRSKEYEAFSHQRQRTKARGLPWELSFDEWMEIWKESCKFSERGRNGYQMCRIGDEGGYTRDNVYIAHSSTNKADAYKNGKQPKSRVRTDGKYGRYISRTTKGTYRVSKTIDGKQRFWSFGQDLKAAEDFRDSLVGGEDHV